MNKIKLCLITGLLLTMAVFTCLVVGAAENSSEEIYEYGVVYNSYKTEGVNCVVKDPDGINVKVRSNNYFVPEKAGTYTIEYSNKVVKLIVREYPDAPEYFLKGEFAKAYSVGETLVIPTLQTVNPEDHSIVENYRIQVFCDGRTVYTTKENGSEYLLTQAGDYKVVYNYRNVYGMDTGKDYEFEVNADAVLIMPEYESMIRLGSSIDLTAVYGYYNGEKFLATHTVSTPSKTVCMEGRLTFDEKGTYKLTSSANIGGKVLSKERTFEVFADLGNLFTTIDIDEIESDASLQPYTNVTKGQKGIKLITGNLGAKAYYNTPIDLNGMTKDTNVIEFEVLSSDLAYMNSITIRLTDVYDYSNWLAITWKDCSHGSVPVQKGVHSYSYLSCSNGFSGSCYNSDPDTMRFGTGSAACMVNHTSCFHGKYKMQGLWSNMLGTFNCQFNYQTKEFYTYDDKYYRQRRMADLDSVALMGNYAWNGFTTGEVYLSIEFNGVVGEESGINVLQIAGKNLSSDSMKLKPIGDIRMDTDMDYIINGLPEGAVGYEYPVPAPVTSNMIRDRFEVNTNLYKVSGGLLTDVTSAISDGKFTPDESGTYRITYSYNDAHGFVSSKSYDFNVTAEQAEITLEQLTDPSPVMLSWFMLPTFSYSGGKGKLNSAYAVRIDGVEQPVENNRVFIDKNCEIQVDFIVTDYIGYQKTVTKTYVVDYDKYLVIGSVPVALRSGSKVFFDDFAAYDFNFDPDEPGYLLEKKLYIDGVLYNAVNGYVVPSNKTSVTLKFCGANKNDASDSISETYVVPVVTVAGSGDMSNFFIGEEGIGVSTKETSVQLSFGDDGFVKFINPVAAEDLALAFKINSSKAEKVVILLEDYQDETVQLKLEFEPYEGTKSAFYVNGEFIAFISGNFEGLSYQISFDNHKYAFYDSGKLLYTVSKTLNGNVFEGFNGAVKLKFGLEGVSQNCGLEIETIGNQSFGTEAYKKGDLSAPQFVFDRSVMSSSTVSIGDNYDTPISRGFDVLKGATDVKLTVYDPDGNTLYNNVAATKSYSLTFNRYGYYRLQYKTTDGSRTATKELRFYVLDEVVPEINISEAFPTAAKVGDTIALPMASVSDNVKIAVQMLYVITPEGRRITISWGDLYGANASYRFGSKGNYTFVYCVYDKDYNITRKTFTVCVM